MTRLALVALSLVLLSASAAAAGTLKSNHGTFGSFPQAPTPPKPPTPPGYRSQNQDGAFKPWKPTMRVDSNRGGIDAYPHAKKPRGYIGPF